MYVMYVAWDIGKWREVYECNSNEIGSVKKKGGCIECGETIVTRDR
jgi:hypothetical protein